MKMERSWIWLGYTSLVLHTYYSLTLSIYSIQYQYKNTENDDRTGTPRQDGHVSTTQL